MVEISEGNLFVVDGNTYKIEKFIGKGKGGYSYIAECNNEKYVFKQLHYEPCSTYTFGSNKLEAELRDYNRLKETGIQMPNLIAFDDKNQRLVKNFIEGDTLAQIISKNLVTDSHISQIFSMCKNLYSKNLNIDYFPTNFIVDKNNTLHYIDFECNQYMQEWDFENWGIYFLANPQGWLKFIETNDSSYINNEHGKPVKTPEIQAIVDKWLLLPH